MNERGPRNDPKPVETRAEFEAARAEVGLYSILVKTIHLWPDNREQWERGDPKEIIDAMLARIPDAPRTVSRNAGAEELAWQLPPSEIEAYLLYKVATSNPKAFYFDELSPPEDSFDPAESIMCLRDGVRTKKFTSAIGRAVMELESGNPLQVIDAGSGAMPIMGIYAALSAPNVSVTCIEMNPHSAAFAREVVAALELSDRITVVESDATSYTPESSVDLLVSETMNSGLLSEPLVDIMNNLAKSVSEGGKILPDKVETIAASVSREAYEGSEELVQIYGVPCPKVDVEWTVTSTYYPGEPLTEISGVVSGSEVSGEERVVLLSSRVGLGSDTLESYESLLSTPLPLGAYTQDVFALETYSTKPGESLSISYPPGAHRNEIQVSKK